MNYLKQLARALPLVGLVIALAAFSAGAVAHTGLKESIPANGASVATAPSEMKLVFTAPVALMKFELLTAANEVLTADFKPVITPAAEFMVAIPMLQTGQFKANWTVVAADGHPVSGSVTFTVDAAAHANTGHGDHANHADHAGQAAGQHQN